MFKCSLASKCSLFANFQYDEFATNNMSRSRIKPQNHVNANLLMDYSSLSVISRILEKKNGLQLSYEVHSQSPQ